MLATTKSYKYHRGGMTITLSLLLLLLALTSAVYTANTKLLDVKIADAHYRKDQAHIAAQMGLEHAISHVRVNPSFSGTLDKRGAEKFTIQVRELITGGSHSVLGYRGDKILTIDSTGYSSDWTSASDWHSTRVLQQKIWQHAIVRTAPQAAITVSGTIKVGGNFKVGANPNGGGNGVPLSIWSDNDVTLSGAGSTCALEEFNNAGMCTTQAYSDKDHKGSDILQNDTGFPDDLLAHTFGYATDDYLDLKSIASEVLTSCANLKNKASGFYWISGACTIKDTVGNFAAPVIVVVQDSDLKLNAGAEIFGILFSLDTSKGANPPTNQMTGHALIEGALISDNTMDLSAGTLDIRYNADILALMTNPLGCGTPPCDPPKTFNVVEIIPGSWKDF